MGWRKFWVRKVDATSRSGGILTIWNSCIFCNTMTMGEEGYLEVVGSWKGVEGLVGLLNVYGPQDIDKKETIWKKLGIIMESIYRSDLVCFW